jgi:hypothetical protein
MSINQFSKWQLLKQQSICLSVLPIDIIHKHTSKICGRQQVAKEIHGQPVWAYFNTSECPPVEDLEDVALDCVFYVHQ